MLSWLMFVASGIGPFTGQCVHFKHYAPEPDPLRHQPLRLRSLAALEDPRTPTWPTGRGW